MFDWKVAVKSYNEALAEDGMMEGWAYIGLDEKRYIVKMDLDKSTELVVYDITNVNVEEKLVPVYESMGGDEEYGHIENWMGWINLVMNTCPIVNC